MSRRRDKAVQDAAQAIRRFSRAATLHHTEALRYAVVTNVDPIQLEVGDANLVLEEEDVEFSSQVATYNADVGLDEGDAMVVALLDNGDWVALAVLSDEVDSVRHAGGLASVQHGDTIAHGLDGTPSIVQLTPTVGNRHLAATTVTATNITVSLRDSDGATVTSPENVYWKAEV